MVNNLQLCAGNGWNLQKMRVPQNWETTSNKVSTVSSYGFLRAAQNQLQRPTYYHWRMKDERLEQQLRAMLQWNIPVWHEKIQRPHPISNQVFQVKCETHNIHFEQLHIVRTSQFQSFPLWLLTPGRYTLNFSAGCVLASATPNRKPCKVWIRYPVYTNSTEFLSFGDGLVMFSG